MIPPAQSPPSTFTLIFSAALAVLSLNMFLPSLAHIVDDLDTSYALVNLSIAGFLAATAVIQIVMGPLSDMYGRRPVILVSTLIFTLASIGCALAESIWVFLGFRLLQGAGISGQVISRAAIRDLYSQNEAASRLGYIAMVMAVAPMLGPMLGGVLETAFGWRAAFVLYTALGLALLVLLWTDFGETNLSPSSTFGKQLRDYPQLLGARRFWGYALCAAFSVGGFFSFVTGAPLVALAWFDMSPAALGVGLGVITGGFMVGSFITGKIAARTSLISMILAGRLVALAGPILALSFFATGAGSMEIFFGAAICVGFGNGLTMSNAQAGLMSVRPKLAGSASGLAGALIGALGALLTSSTGALVSPENAPFAVMGVMLTASVLAFLAALYVAWLDRRDPLPDVM